MGKRNEIVLQRLRRKHLRRTSSTVTDMEDTSVPEKRLTWFVIGCIFTVICFGLPITLMSQEDSVYMRDIAYVTQYGNIPISCTAHVVRGAEKRIDIILATSSYYGHTGSYVRVGVKDSARGTWSSETQTYGDVSDGVHVVSDPELPATLACITEATKRNILSY